MADNLDFAPAALFAEVRTTTDVIGNPPINEHIIFPIPCALNSTLVLVYRLWTSILSAASMHNSVSIEATIAIVIPTTQTCGFVNPAKLGVTIIALNSSNDDGTGNETKCSF